MKPGDFRILIACEESQRVCIAFRKRGFEAYSCDIQECSGGHPEWHIKQDVLPLLNGSCEFVSCDGINHKIYGKWDMIIAHPPCTYMSKAGARFMYPTAGNIDNNRLEKALKAKEFFLKIQESDCEKIVIENPTPLKIVGLPLPQQIIQPWQYDKNGDEQFTKRTLLWIKGVELLKPINLKPLGRLQTWIPSNTGGYSRGKGGSRGIAHDAVTASKTFNGIAEAMAEQWGNYLLEEAKR